ncbi:hypothetical protein DL96DRAFT_1628031 [Flagelloscypha sp. PMI_526]|nr:hypothetical protein DL96DRAFT_1628031 [Flagelloscypha sp. PMI_526]
MSTIHFPFTDDADVISVLECPATARLPLALASGSLRIVATEVSTDAYKAFGRKILAPVLSSIRTYLAMSSSAVPLPRGVMLPVAGPSWIGNLLNSVLTGILIVQVYIYYVAFPKDQWFTKMIVYSVFVLEILQTILREVDHFEIEVMRFGDASVFNEGLRFWLSTPILTAVTSGIVQAYFGYRIRVFSGTWVFPLAVWLPILVQLGSGIGLGIMSAPVDIVEVATNPRMTAAFVVWIASTTVVDVLIAVLLTYFLYNMRSGIKGTQDLLTKIIRLTIETGTVTAVWGVLIIILYFQMPPWFVIFADSWSKLYSNNLMVMFNRRVNYRLQAPGSTVHFMGTENGAGEEGGTTQIEFSVRSKNQFPGTEKPLSTKGEL